MRPRETPFYSSVRFEPGPSTSTRADRDSFEPSKIGICCKFLSNSSCFGSRLIFTLIQRKIRKKLKLKRDVDFIHVSYFDKTRLSKLQVKVSGLQTSFFKKTTEKFELSGTSNVRSNLLGAHKVRSTFLIQLFKLYLDFSSGSFTITLIFRFILFSDHSQ